MLLAIALSVALAIAGCGGGDSTGSSGLDTPRWMLTIIAPRHGAQVGGQAHVEVALTGMGVALDEPRDFSVGYFLDERLVLQSADLVVELDVPPGGHLLRVLGVDETGKPSAKVVGDRIQLVRSDGAAPP
ncbi:hypothetical protein AKJ08_2808 [Vulgatibacter incomptus]|uniref:Uncharacterized protein n=1 Tax=Vulgatibacter incomptus TaxID=1391653 RepID=A0A0K1PG75_9BACT|nr:hypothetical protein AKJ08_2808 [Vulgatibacter incomptus]